MANHIWGISRPARQSLRSLCLAIVLSSCAACIQDVQTDSARAADEQSLWTRPGIDWPGFLGGKRDSKSSETGLNMDLSSARQRWQIQIGEGYGMGSVAKGRFFHFDRVGDQARLRGFNAETGQELWKFQYTTDYQDLYGFDGGPRSSPLIDEQRVYIFGVEGMLHCLDSRDGRLLWKRDTAEDFGVIQNFFGVGSSPIIHGERLITILGGSPPASKAVPLGQLDRVKPNSAAIVAFDKRTGQVVYQTGNDLASYSSPIVATLDGNQIGVALCRSDLLGFELNTGKILWSFPWRARKFESVNASTPVVVNQQILITESYGLGAALVGFQQGQPREIWSDRNRREKSLASHWCTPLVVDGYLYGCSGEKTNSAELRCIELATGKIKWSEPGLTRTSLLLVDGWFVCLAENGRLFTFRPNPERFEIGSELPRQVVRLLGPCWATPIISHGYLYVRDKRQVVCLDLAR